MDLYPCLILLFTLCPSFIFGTTCTEPLLEKCICGEFEYVGKLQYIVNCTNVGFTDTKALERLPINTQVLIFIGNNVTELQTNVFGTENNNTHLRIIDMSNNKIKLIHGKAFHKVSAVERLILNHNELILNEQHPRIFSNFGNMLELHLTDAFADNSSNLAAYLHLVFLKSDLIKLRKLHLEQNEISSFGDPLVFCDLNSLMDLHLSDNKLEHIMFKIECLHNLRFIDLKRNSITYLAKDELEQLDKFPSHNQTFVIDLSENPFSCGYEIQEFFNWLNTTSVTVRNKNLLRCRHNTNNNEEPLYLNLLADNNCHPKREAQAQPKDNTGTISLLAILLCITTGLLLYTHRELIKQKSLPIYHSLSRKIHYTTIGKNESHEMEV